MSEIGGHHLCQGLSLGETALLFAALRHGPGLIKRLPTTQAAIIKRAVGRLEDPSTHNARAWAEHLRARLVTIRRRPRLDLHPEWLEHLEQRERNVATARFKSGTLPDTAIGRSVAAQMAHAYGLRDERHRWEYERGALLEYETLSLLPSSDLEALVMHTGITVAAAAFEGLSRRELAAVAKRIGEPWAQVFIRALREPPEMSRDALKIARARFLTMQRDRVDLELQLRDTGLYVAACAGYGRFADGLVCLAHALPMELGWAIKDHARSIAQHDRSKRISPECLALLLTRLQSLARDGHTEGSYHERLVCVEPPETPHRQKVQ